MNTMSKRSLFLAGGAALLAAVLPVAARAQAQPAVKNRALFQVTDNDPARWNMILNNMINLKEGVGGIFEVFIDGRTAYTNKDNYRFPTDEEIFTEIDKSKQ